MFETLSERAMAKNKNAVLRYKMLDDLLSDRFHCYNLDDITEIVNEKLSFSGYPTVVRRSIEKDIQFLEEFPFYAEIERYRYNGKYCLRYVDSSFSVFRKEPSADEIELLSEVLNNLGKFDGLPNFKWLEGLQNALTLKASKKIIRFSKNDRLRNSSLLPSLFDAISHEQVLDIWYQKFFQKEQERFVFHPFLLKEFNDRWYLVGCLEPLLEYRTLAIDRIVGFSALMEKKRIEVPENLITRYEDVIGITVYEGEEPLAILLWVADASSPYMETKPLHSSQVKVDSGEESSLRLLYPALEGGSFYRLECLHNYELEAAIMGYLANIVVLEPFVLRDSIHQKITNLIEKYSEVRI